MHCCDLEMGYYKKVILEQRAPVAFPSCQKCLGLTRPPVKITTTTAFIAHLATLGDVLGAVIKTRPKPTIIEQFVLE
jgi:hypothetical protein